MTCPVTKAETVTDAEGYFTLTGSAPVNESGTAPRLGIWFEQPGHIPVSKTLQLIPEVDNTVLVVLGKESSTQTVTLPFEQQSRATTLGNATFTFFHDSLVNENGGTVTGEVEVEGATWEPILTEFANHPVFPAVQPMGDGSTYVSPLVITRFAVAQAGEALTIGGTEGIGLSMTSLNPMDTPLGSEDDRLFYVDGMSGILVESGSNKLDHQNNILHASMDRTGTWVWARDVAKPTCVNVEVSIAGGGPVLGAYLRLVDDNGIVFDEQLGVPGGIFCLRAPQGKTAQIQAWLAGEMSLRETTQNVLTGSGGTCSVGCPKSFAMEFPCESPLECPEGSVCTGGSCSQPVLSENGRSQ